MPPAPTWYQGRPAVGAFLAGSALTATKRWRLVPTRANGQLAVGEYLWDPARASFTPHGLAVLTLRGARIADITGFVTPEVLERFELPAKVSNSTDTKS
jgi:RNA polymerase sigma-70 factor (ECF subfamily)